MHMQDEKLSIYDSVNWVSSDAGVTTLHFSDAVSPRPHVNGAYLCRVVRCSKQPQAKDSLWWQNGAPCPYGQSH
jgi:hypothetical protein